MCKIKIDLDSYKEFFKSECGLKLITEIIDSGDYEAVRGLTKWSECTSDMLDRIASKYMSAEKVRKNLELLEDVAEHSRISVKTLEKLFDFASGFVGQYEEAIEVLEEIAESKKLNGDIAWKLYNLAVKKALVDVIEELAENSNTPDEILFAILDTYKKGSKQCLKAYEQIAKRYKKLLNESDNK
ncbi:MAG: hypothetical protein IJ272_01605 [Clostridia bacterium]|nr:hypothetical protein [Clostridia bacterium]